MPSSASAIALTPPPNRVAIPPASTTRAICPSRSAAGPGCRRLVVARLPRRRQVRQVGRQWRLDRPGDDVRRCPERPVAKRGPQPLEGFRIEAVSLECLARGRVELVEDHRDLAGAGSESA